MDWKASNLNKCKICKFVIICGCTGSSVESNGPQISLMILGCCNSWSNSGVGYIHWLWSRRDSRNHILNRCDKGVKTNLIVVWLIKSSIGKFIPRQWEGNMFTGDDGPLYCVYKNMFFDRVPRISLGSKFTWQITPCSIITNETHIENQRMIFL